jgi:hypothetical protein
MTPEQYRARLAAKRKPFAKRKRTPQQSESSIVRVIIVALTAKRIWCWRANSGVIPVTSAKYGKRVVVLSPPGTPDILGVLPGGRLFGLEVKTRSGRQQPSQVAWQLRAEENGVRYAVVRSVTEALAAILDKTTDSPAR